MVLVKDGIRKAKLQALHDDGERPYLAVLKVIQFRRGSDKIFTKTATEKTYYKAYDVTMSTYDVTAQPELVPTSKRPGASAKVAEVLKNIGPHLPAHKRMFWENIGNNSTQTKRSLSHKSVTGSKRRKTK